MFLALFQSSYQKEAQLLARNARKLLHKKRDVLSAATVADLQSGIDRLEDAAHRGDETAVKETSERLDKEFGRFAPQQHDAALRENCEVILVAIVLAIGIRAFFIQPFKIPTGSMEPTLNGITGHPIAVGKPLPGVIGKTWRYFLQGRTYIDAVSAVDDRVTGLHPEKHAGLFNYTRILCESGRSYLVYSPPETLRNPLEHDGFGVRLNGDRYRAGEPIARGYVDTGDQVFVDKFTYHFRQPRRSDVFVFNTAGISGISMNDPNVQSQFYIKRLAGTPGDKLQIRQPYLFINDELAKEPGFQHVMTQKEGYHGYANLSRARMFVYLTTPADDYTVPAASYFALGDNSFNSSDSRAWGQVPAENVVGRGLFVYYPFTSHWGFVR